MSRKQPDRRAQRSQRGLQLALMELLAKKPYRKITVVDIVKRADVSRPTFYLHFETKNDLLVSCVDRILEDFYEALLEELLDPASTVADPYREGTRRMFERWYEHASFFSQLRQAEVEHLTLQCFRKYHRRMFLDFVPTEQLSEFDPGLLEYSIEYATGAFYMLLMRWTDEGMPYSVDEMTSLLIDLEQNGFMRMFFGEEPQFDTQYLRHSPGHSK